MSWKSHLHDLWKKIVVAVVGGIVLSSPLWSVAMYGWFTSIVHADEMKADLEALATMIGQEVATQIRPIAQQATANARELCLSRRTALRSARQALVDDVDKLQNIAERSDSEDLLLRAWKAELAETEDELETLGTCDVVAAP